jgi:hypothetical protein
MILFIGLRLSLVIASACIPASAAMGGPVLTSVLAVFVAALTGLDTQFRWGEEWRHFRSTQIALERMQREYRRRKAALLGNRTIGKITTEDENFDKLYMDVEEILQTEADSFFKFRITEWRSPQGNSA